MIQNQNQNILYTQTRNNLYGYVMSNFLPTRGFKWIDTEQFNLNKYTCNSSEGCVLEVDYEYPKELHELHNN